MTLLAPHSADEPDVEALLRELEPHLRPAAHRVRGMRSAADLTRVTAAELAEAITEGAQQ